MSESPCPCNLAAWPSATMNTSLLELPMYSAASNRKQEFTLRRSPRPGRRWNLQTSSSPSPPLSHGADHPSGHGQPEFPHPEGADGPLRRGRGWGAVGSVHRSLHAGTRKLAESGGTGDRPLFQAMFGEAPTRRRSGFSGRKPAPGTGEPTEIASRSIGHSIARKPERSSNTSTTPSGQRPSRIAAALCAGNRCRSPESRETRDQFDATVTVNVALSMDWGFQTLTVSWSPAASGHIPL